MEEGRERRGGDLDPRQFSLHSGRIGGATRLATGGSRSGEKERKKFQVFLYTAVSKIDSR